MVVSGRVGGLEGGHSGTVGRVRRVGGWGGGWNVSSGAGPAPSYSLCNGRRRPLRDVLSPRVDWVGLAHG